MFCLFVVVFQKVRSKCRFVSHIRFPTRFEETNTKRRSEGERDYFDREDVLRRKKVAHQKKNTKFRACERSFATVYSDCARITCYSYVL